MTSPELQRLILENMVLRDLVRRGLSDLGEQFVVSVHCASYAKLNVVAGTWIERDNIRAALALLRDNRAWALRWLRTGIRNYRQRTECPPRICTDTPAEQIYQLYPRKVGKPKALKAISRQIKKFGFELVRSATARFADAWKNQPDLEFCPFPSTWFNQERFNDLPETWAPKTANAKPIQPKPALIEETLLDRAIATERRLQARTP